MERVLRIPEEKGWLKIGWVSSSRYNREKGTVSFKFDPDLKPYLLQLKREFTKSKLLILTQFQSIYSIRIYQLLKQYQNIGWREFKLDELKEILGLRKTQYSVFKDFDRRVLNQAKKEFEKKDKAGNCKCDLTFKLEKIREGRKIARLKFIIIKQEYHEIAVIVPDNIEKKEEETRPKKPQTVKEQLVYYGISEKLAVGFLNQIGEADILDILKYYSDLLQSGKVKSTGGAYLAKLLREGIMVKSSYEKDKAAAAELKKKQREFEQKQKEFEALAKKKAEADQQKKKIQLKEQFDSLPEADQEELLLEFEGTLDRFMFDYYREAGVDSVVVRGTFADFLDGKLH
jgi:hypothetical protein